jgi:hypothetical protein
LRRGQIELRRVKGRPDLHGPLQTGHRFFPPLLLQRQHAQKIMRSGIGGILLHQRRQLRPRPPPIRLPQINIRQLGPQHFAQCRRHRLPLQKNQIRPRRRINLPQQIIAIRQFQRHRPRDRIPRLIQRRQGLRARGFPPLRKLPPHIREQLRQIDLKFRVHVWKRGRLQQHRPSGFAVPRLQMTQIKILPRRHEPRQPPHRDLVRLRRLAVVPQLRMHKPQAHKHHPIHLRQRGGQVQDVERAGKLPAFDQPAGDIEQQLGIGGIGLGRLDRTPRKPPRRPRKVRERCPPRNAHGPPRAVSNSVSARISARTSGRKRQRRATAHDCPASTAPPPRFPSRSYGSEAISRR